MHFHFQSTLKDSIFSVQMRSVKTVLNTKRLSSVPWFLGLGVKMGPLPKHPGGGHGTPLQYHCLENCWTEELGGLQSWGLRESDTTERLSTHSCQSITGWQRSLKKGPKAGSGPGQQGNPYRPAGESRVPVRWPLTELCLSSIILEFKYNPDKC